MEKLEGDNCVAFIQGFIASHMALEALCEYVENERAQRIPTYLKNNRNGPRLNYVVFLRYTDKMNILPNAA